MLYLRDGRMRPLEDSPSEDEADPAVLSTEDEEVSPDKWPTTGGVRVIILGNNFTSVRLYVRFGDFIRELCVGLVTRLTGCWHRLGGVKILCDAFSPQHLIQA